MFSNRSSTWRVVATASVLALSHAATTVDGTAHAAGGPTAVTTDQRRSQTIETDVADSPRGVCVQNLARPLTATTAQKYGAGYEYYDSWGATDFRVTSVCKVKTVDIPGMTQGGGPASGIAISFHERSPSSPALCATKQRAPGPSFTVNVKKACSLEPGKIYWLVAQVSQPYEPAGQWFWDATSQRLGGRDQWKNPGDGFGTGCTTWDTLDLCTGFAVDFRFRITS